ncbi:MAG: gfo/Idh/MocA family oxidoreductase [Planctomycetia bacterium]|nr:gfo/Idh/MocA family oxidoreductase [Planctomycetia bacterium]
MLAQLSRRDLLERALATAAASVACLPPARVRAEKPAAVGPNDRLRVAVVGANGRGGYHIGGWLANPETELVAVCDCDPGVAAKEEKRFAQLPRKPAFEQDIRRLLDRQDIDIISIASPNHWHALMTIWAMQAGKDVYVEKPCSHNVLEGRVMVDWARKLGRLCQMGAQSRSMPGMRQAVEFVTSGKIGAVKLAHALCYKRRPSIGLVDTPAPLPRGLDFDLWAGPAPAEVPIRKKLHYDWHWDRRTGNGDLGNQNPHELDKARWGLGKQELPKRVVSLGGRLGYVDNGDVANSQVTIYQWDDAVLVSDVRGLEIKAPETFGLEAGPLGVANIWWGSEGYVVAPNYTSGVAFDYDGKELGKWSGGSDQHHYDNFVTAVKSRRREDLNLDIEDGHLSSALAHLGNVSWALGKAVEPGTRPSLAADDPRVKLSLESFEAHLAANGVNFAETTLTLGRTLTIDPATETSDDPEANRLFTREYRKGYELPRV